MNEAYKTVYDQCDGLLNQLDPELKVNAAARLFMEHCLSDAAATHGGRLAPLISTVADALTKDLDIEKRLELGVKTVQTYLRVPAVEYFGDTLIRQQSIDEQGRDEMLSIKPEEEEFGSFLLSQGIITQDQRDVAIITQRRLLTIKEVYAKLLQTEGLELDDNSMLGSLKGIIDHFLTSTKDLEDSLRESKRENTRSTLSRLDNIISETEICSHNVLEIVDKIFVLADEIEKNMVPFKELAETQNDDFKKALESINDQLDSLVSLNMELNESQGIQDRIGQQLTKIIPTIQSFHDQLMKVAKKLRLNIESFEEQDESVQQDGYGKEDTKRMSDQGDVDDLLANLGL